MRSSCRKFSASSERFTRFVEWGCRLGLCPSGSAPLQISVAADEAIQKQNAIKVIDFVLGDARLKAAEHELAGLAVSVECLDFDFFGADDFAGVIGDGEATLSPDSETIPMGDFRVNQHEWSVIFHGTLCFRGIDKADALQLANLRSGNADGARPVRAGFEQVIDEGLQLGTKVFYRLAGRFQSVVWISENR